MTKELRLNAFELFSPAPHTYGLWRHPRDKSTDYTKMSYWQDLARTLERGLFDGVFLADVVGAYDVHGGSPAGALRGAVQVPLNDPMLIIPAMAAVTENLSFAVTATLSFEHPVPFARRMTTLDHLTDGRVGWNIVTGFLESAARGARDAEHKDHDVRYDVAEEYMEIMYRLWEGSWRDDAVVRDKENGIYTNPDAVEPAQFHGEHLDVDAIQLAEPSPQRTPLLLQAGASTKGRTFAAKHAEVVFVSGPSADVTAETVADLRKRAADFGRDPSELKILSLLSVITGETDEEAQAKEEDYRQYILPEAALVSMSAWSGIDLSTWALDETFEHTTTNAGQGLVNAFTKDPNRSWTLEEIAEDVALGSVAPLLVGSPSTIVDGISDWVEKTDVDGFNIVRLVSPETYVDFVDLVVPELQRRGMYKRSYTPGTYREKISGGEPRLSSPHPGASFRR